MKPKSSVNNQSTTIARMFYTNNSVTSKDGTTIGYRQLGHGPGLVLLHGTMESAQSHLQLAEALADTFTVYLPDRRGRGLSGPYSEDYSIKQDVEDLDVLLTGTGAYFVFGVSVGAIVCLQAALSLPAIHKVAIFEPPLIINGSVSTDFLTRYDEEIAQGDVASALVTGMLGSQMGPPIFNSIPRWLLKLLTRMMMASEDKKAKGDYVTMRMLAPTMHYDLQLAVESEGLLESFKAISAEMLLLGSSKSPAYFKVALKALEEMLPHAKRIEFPGLNHGASGNTNRGGQPERVAQELRRFFI
ncbi:alpha/beta fold hydrolase [Paenibacillus mendelii]|uniref:Alpha/beta fold hydrolase n=1 Tax=Paenibacillus mendelii TaxID=206163 RepID=A0ABV6J9V6_9BACL|nr:alpha/beta hydrolase [Paenibacillus mendelii]MCQ6564083.1 alpha/beta hydrolase [Paenibacillus mendelii]